MGKRLIPSSRNVSDGIPAVLDQRAAQLSAGLHMAVLLSPLANGAVSTGQGRQRLKISPDLNAAKLLPERQCKKQQQRWEPKEWEGQAQSQPV
ncbi:hypothetical protein [uncultured Oscillibacter sp.]|uniref:hypothetical protein n=1 Tax=uncultured Oscillibacter sp. TaxID=876091 RepID=UPI0025F06D74|nr:hypothetical protein [uncultured Oscillibacter sp.]